MKNLGVISVLLVLTNFAFADAETEQPQQQQLTLAMNDFVPKPVLVEFQIKPFATIDENSTLVEVNAKLEAKLDQKLDALLATQLQSLD